MNFQQKNNFVTVYKQQQSLINNLCHSDFQLNIDLTHSQRVKFTFAI